MFLVDLVQAPLDLQNVLGMALDVGRLPLEAARGLVQHDAALGSAKRRPASPAQSNSDPIEPPGRRTTSKPSA